MSISIIAAVALNNVIGRDNSLLWHISDDLKRFKSLTLNKPIIMGRKTYESLPFKPLPKRRNIVVTRKPGTYFEGALVANSMQEAIETANANNEEIFICGGAQIYEYFLPFADKIYLTKVFKEYEGDTIFPFVEYNLFEKTYDSGLLIDENTGLEYSFLNFTRKKY